MMGPAHTYLQKVEQETGLTGFGPPDFIEPLNVFLSGMDKASLTEGGLAAHDQSVRRWLANRARFAADVERYPEILDEDVSDPIVILGFPRSGTTLLHRMMSADPAMQPLLTWRMLNPAPLPGEIPGKPTERIAFAKQIEDWLRGNPEYFAAHPTLAEDAEEDFFLHFTTFQHVGHFVFLPTPAYLSYLRTLPKLPTYQYAADLLRYLQWQDGGRRGRCWALKSPVHIGYLDEILQMHPKATFVYPRREIATVIASFCRLLETYCLNYFPQADPLAIGRLAIAFWSVEMQRFEDSRRRLGDRLVLMDVPYRDLLTDPLPFIRRIYGNAGRSLTGEGEAAIRAWIARNPAGKHGTNMYDLARYGLSDAVLAEAFDGK